MKQLLVGICLFALCGAAVTPDAYQPFVGSWSCTRPTIGSIGWTANLTVATTADGALEFTATQTSPGSYRAQWSPTHFYLKENPQSGLWTFSSPTDPYELTGRANERGEILMAGPALSRQRFAIALPGGGKTMTLLRYRTDNEQNLNLANDLVQCSRT